MITSLYYCFKFRIISCTLNIFRCPVTLHPKPYDPCLMYPECVNRPATPHFVTPIYNNPTPYIRWSSTSPETKTFPVRCRALFSEHLKCQCPNSAPAIGSNLMMFLQCQESWCGVRKRISISPDVSLSESWCNIRNRVFVIIKSVIIPTVLQP